MTTKAHPHGEHVCVCPSCGHRKTVGVGERCNQVRCPECGDRMRAEDTGEFRSQR
jgi:ribosomal protein S27E